jgi:hypothetical protein
MAGGFETGAMAPGAFSSGVIARDPVVKPIPGGVRVTHMERALSVNCEADKVKYEHIEVSPRMFPWIKGFAHHFQNFRVQKFHAHFAPVAPTDSGTRVVLSPYYSSAIPYVKSPAGSNDKALINLGTLPGAKQFAGWAEAKVSWIAARAVRQTFKLFNITKAPQSLASLQSTEDQVPGYVIAEMNTPGTAMHVGDLWAEYTFDLLDPIVQANGVSVYTNSTNPAGLGLHECDLVTGPVSMYRFRDNNIHFLVGGFYTVIIYQLGTDPLPDEDGIIVSNGVGTDVTEGKLLSSWDVSSGVLDLNMDSADVARFANTSTKAMQILYLSVDGGDYITLDDFTSGTLTGTYIDIIPNAPAIPLRP